MEYGLLFRKTSTCYKNPDIEYLDETSDYKLNILAKKQGLSIEDLRAKNEEVNKSINYLTKEDHGRVYAGGFLRDMLLSKKALAPEKWDNEVRKKAIKSAIYKNTRQFGVYRGSLGHKLVFSLSEDLEEKLNKSNLNVDEILRKEVKKIMYQFQKKFHPGEKIGFAWGIHHDTKHRHIHIYLCNRTDKGTHVAMSSPLKGRSRKYQQKDQMGYMKEQVQKSQKRILEHVSRANRGQILRSSSSILITEFDRQYAEEFRGQEEEIERMRQSLVAQENELKIHQEMIRRCYTDYNLRKELVAEGYRNVRSLNHAISQSYENLQKNDSVVTPKLLNQLGLFPRSGPLKQFSKLLFAMHNSIEHSKRAAIFRQINQTREYKTRLVNQLKFMDWQRKHFLKGVAEMKERRAELQQKFYRNRYHYERSLLRHNFDFFMKTVNDQRRKKQYYAVTKRLWQNRRAGKDSSKELRLIKYLDREAKTIYNLEALKAPKEEPEKKYISDYFPENNNDNQNRGIRM